MRGETGGKSSLERIFDQIRAERSRGIYIRLAIVGIVLVVVIGFILSIYSKVKNFDVNTFVFNLQKKGAKSLWPVISTELDNIATDVGPAIGKAFQKEAENLGQKTLNVLEREANILSEDLKKRMLDSLESSLTSVLEKEKKRIADLKAFTSRPELAEDLFVKIENISREWALEQLDTTFKDHVRILQSLNETVHEFERQAREELRKDAKMKKPEVKVEDLLELFLEIVNARLEGGGKGVK